MEARSDTSFTRVLCVDDNSDMTAAIRLLIEREPTMSCVGCLGSADDLTVEARRLEADVVLLDATMPGRSPLEAMSEMAATLPRSRTIVFSGHDDQEFIERALDAGAWGYISKHDEPSRIVQGVRQVAAGHSFFPPHPALPGL